MLNRNDIITEVHKSGAGNVSKAQIEAIVNKTLTTIVEKVAAGEDVRLGNDFGTFTVTERAARKGRNPATGEQIDIAASRAVKFKPSNSFKNAL